MLVSARTQNKQWVIRPPDGRSRELARSVKVSPLLAQLLINRGVTEMAQASAFLRPRLTDLIEPERMPGIGPAVERLKQAVADKQKITVYGDYDVDGITGVAILWSILASLGASVEYYIPHRVDEGYGLNAEAVESLAGSGTKLLVTVDCGITAFRSAERAAELGLDLIITDHHQPDSQMPRAERARQCAHSGCRGRCRLGVVSARHTLRTTAKSSAATIMQLAGQLKHYPRGSDLARGSRQRKIPLWHANIDCGKV